MTDRNDLTRSDQVRDHDDLGQRPRLLEIYSQPIHTPPMPRDQFWIAPEGLGIREARKQRVSPYYKTRSGAVRGLRDRLDKAKRDA
jgi:hypothetical protein